MRIAQVSTLATPVHNVGSGSIEKIVWLLARDLTHMGHQVTVFASAGSEVSGELVATLPGSYAEAGSPDDWQLCEWINLCRAVEQSERFDVIHSHAYLWGLPLEPLARAAMVHTLHVQPGKDQEILWSRAPNACVTALSNYQWSAYSERPPAAVIYSGVDTSEFTLQLHPQDYVCFLGRFTVGKGPLRAIAAARSLGLRLLLAGPYNEYYRHHVEPHVDGRTVEYVGSVSGSRKNELLGGARALLYPLQSPEPFGLVQIEAMMCGTPVVAMGLGAVPEIVEDGLTGYCADTDDMFEQQILHSFDLDRRQIRERAETRFSAELMARQYAQLYERLASNNRR